jgi:hypothetical protein
MKCNENELDPNQPNTLDASEIGTDDGNPLRSDCFVRTKVDASIIMF